MNRLPSVDTADVIVRTGSRKSFHHPSTENCPSRSMYALKCLIDRSSSHPLRFHINMSSKLTSTRTLWHIHQRARRRCFATHVDPTNTSTSHAESSKQYSVIVRAHLHAADSLLSSASRSSVVVMRAVKQQLRPRGRERERYFSVKDWIRSERCLAIRLLAV